MTIDELKELIDSYGAQLGRWPEDDRARAVALSIRSSEARELFQESLAMERFLCETETALAPEGFADRIIAKAHSKGVREEVRKEMRLAAASIALLGDLSKIMPHGKTILPVLFLLGVISGGVNQLDISASNGVTDFLNLLIYYS